MYLKVYPYLNLLSLPIINETYAMKKVHQGTMLHIYSYSIHGIKWWMVDADIM